MDEAKFSALMVKLQAATWTISNAISNTKLFSTEINEQKIKLYNVENGPLYINSQRPGLTEAQVQTILDFVNQLIEDFEPEIQAAIIARNQSVATALGKILE